MRPPRSLLALTASALAPALCLVGAVSGCTSDLPAPYDYDVLEPPAPDNELVVDCASLPVTAEGAQYSQSPTITGQLDGATYRHTARDLPAGLAIDERTGVISGRVEAERGAYDFEVTIEDVDDPEAYSATGTCRLEVRPRLTAPIAVDTACLRPGQDLRDLVVDGTGDGTPITCDAPGGSGNGRKPNGVEVDPERCTVTGTIAEERYGTWVFVMRGTQSGAQVFVPYCVENDVPQGYEIVARHSGNDYAALVPVTREYDPTAPFSVGTDMDPRYEVIAPDACGASCFFKYEFLRTQAPLGDDGIFSLAPDGLLQDDMGENIGFYHELRVSGPPVPEEFRERPWVLSASLSYCISDSPGVCDEPAAAGDAAFEFGLIMVPTRN